MSGSLPPSANRLRELRERGQAPRSRALVAAAAVVGATAGLLFCAAATRDALVELLEAAGASLASARGPGPALFEQSARALAVGALPVLAAAAVLAAIFAVAQLGWPMALRLPGRSAGRAPVGRPSAALERAVAAAGKLAALGAMAAAVLPAAREALGADAQSMLLLFSSGAREWLIAAALALAIFGLTHYAWERLRFVEAARMTPAQLRQEQRELEGDPQIKARRMRARRRIANARARTLSAKEQP